MSDKNRQKKDHERTDKKNKAMGDQENEGRAKPPQQARDQSNLNADKRGEER